MKKGEVGGSVTATEFKTTQSNKSTDFMSVTEPQTESISNEVSTEPQTEATSKEKATDIATEPPTEIKNNKAETTVIPTEPKKEYEYYKSHFYELPKAEELKNRK